MADSDELEVVLRKMVEERDPEACLRLLWIFRRAAMPWVPART
jgi:hypothetical protein